MSIGFNYEIAAAVVYVVWMMFHQFGKVECFSGWKGFWLLVGVGLSVLIGGPMAVISFLLGDSVSVGKVVGLGLMVVGACVLKYYFLFFSYVGYYKNMCGFGSAVRD